MRNNVYPCTPQFYYIKVGCKRVFITWTCFRDVKVFYGCVLGKIFQRYVKEFGIDLFQRCVLYYHLISNNVHSI